MIYSKKNNYEAFSKIKIVPTLIILITEYLRHADPIIKTQQTRFFRK